MLFNSYGFIFVFMPIVVAGFVLVRAVDLRFTLIWLTLASIAFYAYWKIEALPILIVSVAFNYAVGLVIARSNQPRDRRALIVGIACNLLALGFFKYAAFAADTINGLLGTRLPRSNIDLPIGISFFTFTQIAYLVDVYRRLTSDHDPVRYALFVTYFPHLIAGPILHHRPMMEQFADPDVVRPRSIDWAVGLTFFSIGLGKKLLLADPLGSIATPLFEAARTAPDISFVAAWLAALTYTFQLYFDFSGYSDMAVGLSLLFGIRIPINFFSPYKATSIIEFWRRWHISLSNFLRDYLYIPLGGNRKGRTRRYVNIFATMLLGGLWHGASWNFVVWGALHGAYLLVNQAWRGLTGRAQPSSPLAGLAGGALTFLAVVVAWVFFRAHDLPTAFRMLNAMTGITSIADGRWKVDPMLAELSRWYCALLLFTASGLAFLALNSVQITDAIRAALRAGHPDGWLAVGWAATFGIVLGTAIIFLGRATEFLYFQF